MVAATSQAACSSPAAMAWMILVASLIS
jgi:hypothetical protein